MTRSALGSPGLEPAQDVTHLELVSGPNRVLLGQEVSQVEGMGAGAGSWVHLPCTARSRAREGHSSPPWLLLCNVGMTAPLSKAGECGRN